MEFWIMIILAISIWISIIIISKHISELIKLLTLNIDRKYEIENSSSNINKSLTMINYTENLLKHIKDFTVEYTVSSYNQFIDNTIIDKTNKSILEKLINQISKEVRDFLKDSSINYDMLIVTDKYIDVLIINTVIYSVKQLFEKSIDEISMGL